MLKPVTVIHCASIFFGLIMFASSSLPSYLESNILETHKIIDKKIGLINNETIKFLKLQERKEFNVLVERQKQTVAAASTPVTTAYKKMWEDVEKRKIHVENSKLMCSGHVVTFNNQVSGIIRYLSKIVKRVQRAAIVELLSDSQTYHIQRKRVDAFKKEADKDDAHFDNMEPYRSAFRAINDTITIVRMYVSRDLRPEISFAGVMTVVDRLFKKYDEIITKMGTSIDQYFWTCGGSQNVTLSGPFVWDEIKNDPFHDDDFFRMMLKYLRSA